MEFATQEEFEDILNKHHNIQYVDAIFTDLCGYVRGKRFPLLEADKIFSDGVLLPFSAFYLDVLGGVTNTLNLGFTDGDPDGVLMPVKNTVHPVPWDKKIIQVLISLKKEQEKWGVIKDPSEVDPRNMLKKVLNKFNRLGFNPVVAFELEFYLLDKRRDKEGKPTPAQGVSKTHVYGIPDLDMFGNLFHEINENCKIQNIPATTASSEFAAGQYEINLRHTGDLLKAADDAALLRRVIKETCKRHGYEATFMAKPFLEETGNGMHLHISVYDDQGKNIFSTPNRYGNNYLKNAIAGLQSTFYDSFPIFIPNRNGYRRIQTRNFVPVNTSWSWNRRDVSLRIPAGSNKAKRIEHRAASADANPYLVLACILSGLHNGLINKLEPNGLVSFDNTDGADSKADDEMPKNLEESLNRFENSSLLSKYLGKEYLKLYTSTKLGEVEHMNSSYIPKEEYDFYL
jgi:glutamine synthetase